MRLVWLRTDLRLEDNPTLFHASQQGHISCVYTLTPQQWQEHHDATAKIAFWRARLIQLTQELAALNIPLKLLRLQHYQEVPQALYNYATSINAEELWFNNEYPVNERDRDDQTEALFQQQGLTVQRYEGDIVIPATQVKTKQNGVYKVFTAFCRQWHKQLNESHLHILPAPQKQKITTKDIATLTTEEPSAIAMTAWGLSDKELNESVFNESIMYRDDLWSADTNHIHQQLANFCQHQAANYKEKRDIPSINGTSTLSPYLAAGMISIRQCIHAMRQQTDDWRNNQWVTELVWREFYRYLLFYYPSLSKSYNFIRMPKPILWEKDETNFHLWCEGKTGFPIVDAAMKQLVQTGWMHNRLRMVTAAFLTKILLIDWRKGESFFMEHLLDGDYASNNGGWQWAASTGADAAPYFRIFNPARQSQRFDEEGKFIKRFLPELSPLDKKSIHTPSTSQREACGYCEPIIDYRWARQRALDSFASAMGKE